MEGSVQEKPNQILLSKRANIFYLEHARVMQKDERIVYLTQRGGDIAQYFNIPERNTSLLLLGKGCSITDAAARRLAESNVVVGFCGSGGTPFFSVVDIAFLSPQSEYRPTLYMQKWAEKWFHEPSRLAMARKLITHRVAIFRSAWKARASLKRYGDFPEPVVQAFQVRTDNSASSQDILLAEAEWAKALYAFFARSYDIEFTRQAGEARRNSTMERINSFLDHGNYLAYGLAAVALNGLGISFSFPLLHGKTRRGALVFDIADLIKDAYVMPCAFECGIDRKANDKDFRSQLIEIFHRESALDQIFDVVKVLAMENTETAPNPFNLEGI
jgi:CRISPR-associated protein Cas1